MTDSVNPNPMQRMSCETVVSVYKRMLLLTDTKIDSLVKIAEWLAQMIITWNYGEKNPIMMNSCRGN